jgi:hypothetical protein
MLQSLLVSVRLLVFRYLQVGEVACFRSFKARTLIVLLNPRSNEALCVTIHEVDVTAFHATAKQDAIRVLHQVDKLFLGSLYNLVGGLFLVSDPAILVEAIDQIFPPDNADVVEFEPLDVIDASNLVDPVRIGGPERCARNAWR